MWKKETGVQESGVQNGTGSRVSMVRAQHSSSVKKSAVLRLFQPRQLIRTKALFSGS